jgi:hypothetical protein
VTTDLAALQSELLARADTAADTAALEAVRLDALGKSGAAAQIPRRDEP